MEKTEAQRGCRPGSGCPSGTEPAVPSSPWPVALHPQGQFPAPAAERGVRGAACPRQGAEDLPEQLPAGAEPLAGAVRRAEGAAPEHGHLADQAGQPLRGEALGHGREPWARGAGGSLLALEDSVGGGPGARMDWRHWRGRQPPWWAGMCQKAPVQLSFASRKFREARGSSRGSLLSSPAAPSWQIQPCHSLTFAILCPHCSREEAWVADSDSGSRGSSDGAHSGTPLFPERQSSPVGCARWEICRLKQQNHLR